MKSPMLAVAAPDDLKFPLYASPKLDGVRAVVYEGVLLSRKMKPIPNRATQSFFGAPFLEGLDGELCVGPHNAKDLMQRTTSGVMSHDGNPDVTFWVFDFFSDTLDLPYSARRDMLVRNAESLMLHEPRVRLLEQRLILHSDALSQYEAECLAQGFEGVMLRYPHSPYKQGRSTAREGYLLKLKRFSDGEAVVTGCVELLHNGNEQTRDETGLAKRSSHMENLVPMNTLGSLAVRDRATGVEFNIGTGFSAAQRQELWSKRDKLIGALVTYRHFKNAGVKIAPRFPVFHAFRSELDVSD